MIQCAVYSEVSLIFFMLSEGVKNIEKKKKNDIVEGMMVFVFGKGNGGIVRRVD